MDPVDPDGELDDEHMKAFLMTPEPESDEDDGKGEGKGDGEGKEEVEFTFDGALSRVRFNYAIASRGVLKEPRGLKSGDVEA